MKSTLPLPEGWLSLAHAFLMQARKKPNTLAVADSTGAQLTYRQLLIASIAVANELDKKVANDFNAIGVLLPPSVGAAVANIAIELLGKVPVNLNYTCGQASFDSSIKTARIEHVISSASVLRRIPINCKSKILKLEDVQEEIDMLDKIKAWSEAKLLPKSILRYLFDGLLEKRTEALPEDEERLQQSHQLPVSSRLNDPATIIFTSGSTAEPKGVLLSHANILSNIHAIRLQGNVKPGETILGVVPFFHSFGYTMTLWAPLCLGETAVYHYDPFDARRICDLCQKFSATMFICTPTMLSHYLRRCDDECFASVKSFVVGGEKLKPAQAKELEQRLHSVPLEGYGLAETSPVISCNVAGMVGLPDGRTVPGTKMGSVGRPLPGTKVQIVDLSTGLEVEKGQQGLILIKGPQVMSGYLSNHHSTERAFRDGWFITGDLGFIDDDGFLTITGRESQFSKIAGEMVPHLAVEEIISRLAGCTDQTVCVTSRSDDKRGEALVVVYSDLNSLTPAEVVTRMKKSDTCRLWIPETDDFIKISEMPHLRNGKLDLRRIKELAQSGTEQKALKAV